MVDIIQSTVIVASSGIENLNHQIQTSGTSGSSSIAEFGPFDSFDNILTSVDVTNSTSTQSFQGANMSTSALINNPLVENDGVSFLIFDSDFSRFINLFGVLGTSGTAEKFFDRSEFFFGPNESDPNTLRDLGDAQQFLLFTQTTINSFDNFNSTVGTASLISSKGSELSSQVSQGIDIISNGSFETGNLGNWQIIQVEPSDVVEVSEGGSGLFGTFSQLEPFEGDYNLSIEIIEDPPRDSISLKQTSKLFTRFDSSILKQFGFAWAVNIVSSVFRSMVAVRFLKSDQTEFIIQYVINAVPPSSNIPVDILDFDRRINLTGPNNQWNFELRNIFEDMFRPSFEFDAVEIWVVTDKTDTRTRRILLDSFSLILNIPNFDLLQTTSFANLFTGHPTASGFPFTISGSDTVGQIDLAPPFFDETFPVSGTSFNPTSPTLSFNIKDSATPLDAGSIDVWIQVNQDELTKVVADGNPDLSITYPIISRSDINNRNIKYEITRATDFPQQATVLVSGTFADLASPANGQTQIYSFQALGSGSLNASITGFSDATPPLIVPVDPLNLATQVSPNTGIVWTTSDNAAGVDPNSLSLIINGKTVITDDLASSGNFSRIPNSNLGFDYEFKPDTSFIFGETVTGTITVSDFASNSGTLTYTWGITPSDTLDILNSFLNPGESVLLTSSTLARIEILDLTHGVDISNTFVSVNGSTPGNLSTTTSGTGPDRVIFEFPLEPLITFRQDLNVFVHAENLFPGNFPVIKEDTFIFRPGYGVNWPNKNLDTDLPGPETEFPFLTNIQVLAEAKNFAKTFNTGTEFYRFLTGNLSRKDLGATIEANIKVADLPAALNVENPFFEYGKTMTLEVEVSDLEGNSFSFTHVFTIEQDPT